MGVKFYTLGIQHFYFDVSAHRRISMKSF